MQLQKHTGGHHVRMGDLHLIVDEFPGHGSGTAGPQMANGSLHVALIVPCASFVLAARRQLRATADDGMPRRTIPVQIHRAPRPPQLPAASMAEPPRSMRNYVGASL